MERCVISLLFLFILNRIPFLMPTLCHKLGICDKWGFQSSEESYFDVFVYDLFNDAVSSIGRIVSW